MKKVAFLIALLLAADAGAQQAPLARLTPEQFIKRFDKNGDGVLTRDELPPRLADTFDRIDTNKDGKLDKQEVAALLRVLRQRQGAGGASAEQTVKRLLDRFDTDKDGKISKAEARQGPLARNFDRIDTNKDGYLDRQELLQAVRRGGLFAGGRPGGGRPGEGGGSGPPTADFDSLDKNADGRLTRQELKGTPYFEKFDAIDTNKDGKIDPKEFAAYLKKQAESK